ncbi:MAG: hypothetical protein ACLVEX_09245 [Ruthenibacterium lactatiformans]
MTYMFSANTPLPAFRYGFYIILYEVRLSIAPDGRGDARVTVRNTSAMDGDEVVQLYGRDVVASIVRPVQELIGICRVLAGRPGQYVFPSTSKAASPTGTAYGSWRPAGVHLVGGHSADVRAEASCTLAQGRRLDPAGRSFFAEASVLAEE